MDGHDPPGPDADLEQVRAFWRIFVQRMTEHHGPKAETWLLLAGTIPPDWWEAWQHLAYRNSVGSYTGTGRYP